MKRRRSLAEYIIRKLFPLMECHLVEANPYGIDKKLYGKNNKAKESYVAYRHSERSEEY